MTLHLLPFVSSFFGFVDEVTHRWFRKLVGFRSDTNFLEISWCLLDCPFGKHVFVPAYSVEFLNFEHSIMEYKVFRELTCRMVLVAPPSCFIGLTSNVSGLIPFTYR